MENNNLNCKGINNGGGRNYGVDLLRIVSMLMIILLHLLGNGGILQKATPLTLKGETIWFLEVSCFCAVNCYGLISGYIGGRSRHKYRGLIYLWIEVLCYAILSAGLILIVNNINGLSTDIFSLLVSILPISSGNFWYFSAYFCLFIFMPLLNEVLDKVSRENLKKVFLVALLVFCIVDPLKENTAFALNRGYSFVWLAFLYMIGGYIARYNPLEKMSAKKSALFYLICCCITYGIRVCVAILTEVIFGAPMKEDLLVEYIFITVLFSAIFLLHTFSKLSIEKEKVCKIISIAASTTFGVYILHTTPFVWNLMQGAFVWCFELNIVLQIVIIVGLTGGIFIACMAMDLCRQGIFKLLHIKDLCAWMEKTIKKILLRFYKIFHLVENKN